MQKLICCYVVVTTLFQVLKKTDYQGLRNTGRQMVFPDLKNVEEIVKLQSMVQSATLLKRILPHLRAVPAIMPDAELQVENTCHQIWVWRKCTDSFKSKTMSKWLFRCITVYLCLISTLPLATQQKTYAVRAWNTEYRCATPIYPPTTSARKQHYT